MPDLAEIGDMIRNAVRDLLAGTDALAKRSYLKPVLYGAGIGGGLALGGLGASQAIHSLQIANYGGQPINPNQYFAPVPYSPYYGYNPYQFGLSQAFDTIFNPLTILLVVFVIIIIIIMIMVSKA